MGDTEAKLSSWAESEDAKRLQEGVQTGRPLFRSRSLDCSSQVLVTGSLRKKGARKSLSRPLGCRISVQSREKLQLAFGKLIWAVRALVGGGCLRPCPLRYKLSKTFRHCPCAWVRDKNKERAGHPFMHALRQRTHLGMNTIGLHTRNWCVINFEKKNVAGSLVFNLAGENSNRFKGGRTKERARERLRLRLKPLLVFHNEKMCPSLLRKWVTDIKSTDLHRDQSMESVCQGPYGVRHDFLRKARKEFGKRRKNRVV